MPTVPRAVPARVTFDAVDIVNSYQELAAMSLLEFICRKVVQTQGEDGFLWDRHIIFSEGNSNRRPCFNKGFKGSHYN